jgi:hypothetical protein
VRRYEDRSFRLPLPFCKWGVGESHRHLVAVAEYDIGGMKKKMTMKKPSPPLSLFSVSKSSPLSPHP